MRDREHPHTPADRGAGAGAAGDWAAGPDTAGHRVVSSLDRMATELDQLREAPLSVLGPRQHVEVLEQVTRLEARLSELKLREAAAADAADVAAVTAAPSTTAWWSHATQQTKGAARAQVQLGKRLDVDRSKTREAFAAGRIVAAQAEVIVAAVDALPADVEPEVVSKAEAHLVAEAAHHNTRELRVLGKRVLDVVAPEVGEEQERKRLEEEEARALQRARFSMSEMTGTAPPTAGSRSPPPRPRSCANSYRPSPRRSTGPPPASRELTRPPGQADRAAPDGVGVPGVDQSPLRRRQPGRERGRAGGHRGGDDDHRPVHRRLGCAGDVGHRGTGHCRAAAWWACEAGFIPVVLGGASQPLDVGRKRRFHDTAQRVAIGLRDKTCTVQGCDWPPGMCHVHHDDPWAYGGKTSVTKGRLLCPHHHAKAHDPAYEARLHADNTITSHRRT